MTYTLALDTGCHDAGLVPRVASDAAAHIGKRIADLRRHSGFTQDELAVRSNIDSSNVRAYEGGRGIPSIHSLVRIADALDVDAADLIRGLTPDLFAERRADGRRHRAR